MDDTQTSRDEDIFPGCSSVHQKRAEPEPSCVSMKSDWSMELPIKFKSGDTSVNLKSVHQKRAEPEPSCVSVKSDWSMELPIKFKSGDTSVNLKSISTPQSGMTKPECRKCDQSMNQPQDLNEIMCSGVSHEVLNTFRLNLLKKFECLREGGAMQGHPTLLNEIYTELYITESESGEISHEHEVRQIEAQSRRAATEDTAIQCSDIFRPLPGQDKAIKTVLTKGVAGIGKTVSVQKFILDWAEGNENQDVQLIFPLPFRELNLMKNRTLSLSDLLHLFFPETTELDISSDKYKVLFIFDGLDECRLSLDFQSDVRLCDVSESASVDELLTNLIKANLLPSALIWITSRPAAADLIPSECVHRLTEVRGFNEPQKEEYFRKRLSNKSLAHRIISHLKSSRSLQIMCHIPVFCWISAVVLEKMMSKARTGKIPKTLTQMYTHFLILQTNIRQEKDYEKSGTDENMILKLGKVAFRQLVKGNVIFYAEDLRESGIDVAEASVYSGLCTQIFREEFGWFQGKVFCFVHLSVQEHLAALYVHLSFTNKKKNVFDQITKNSFFSKVKNKLHLKRPKQVSLSELHQRAVDEALQSKTGHLDLFLRFFLGLSVETHQILLQRLIKQTRISSDSNEETAEYIKEKIRTIDSAGKSINLFHCLNELGDRSLVGKIQQYLTSERISEVNLSSSQWSALVFVLLTSEEELNEFRLDKFVKGKSQSENLQVLKKLLPVIKESRSVQLSSCGFTDEGVSALTSALRSNPSHLRELDLTGNKIGDSVKLLADVLQNPHCKLETLRLRDCGVTDEGVSALTSVLRSNPSHLTELDLTRNKIGDSVKLLSDVLLNPHCKLEKLGLSRCGVTDEGVSFLTSALRSNPSHLRELDLTGNKIGDSVKLLSDVLQNPHCKLEKLGLYNCGVTDEGCTALTSALRSNPSHLTELDLTGHKIGDSVKLLSVVFQNPHCKLEKLRLSHCGVTDEGVSALTSALRSNPSHLTELDLSGNKIGDSVKLLSDVLQNPYCKLEILRLSRCGVTDEGVSALTSALRSNPSHLTELDLSGNKIGDSVKLLSVLQNPHCKLEKLGLYNCGVTDEGCTALTSALRSNPSHLTELDLTGHKIGDSVKLLSVIFQNPHCKLEKLRLRCSDVTDEGVSALTSALRSNPSHLTELDLSGNKIGDSVKLLSDVLENPHCKLEKLRLSSCGVTDEGVSALTSALRSNPSHLTELDLSGNKIGDSVKLLSVLQNPHCKLEKLGLYNCGVTDEGCTALTSALRSNPSHLTELDLTGHKIGDSVKLLSVVFQNPLCKLEKLRLSCCGVTDEGVSALTSALRSNPSHLTELDLSGNKIGDSVKLLSDLLQNPHCKLEKLRLSDCGVTDEGCSALTSALRSNPSHLTELDLSVNKIGDSVKLLSDLLQNPHCKLENLRLSRCGVTDEGVSALTSALRSNPSHLTELDLTGNKIGDSVKLLSGVLQNPQCKLKILGLRDCGVTHKGVSALTSALRSNPSHLIELDLTKNIIGDSVKLLSDVLQNPHCKLEKLRLRDCGVTHKGVSALTSALRSNPSELRELDLTGNKIGDSVKLLSDVLQNPHCKLEILGLSHCGFTHKGFSALTSALRSNPSHLTELDLTGNKIGDSVKLLSDVLQNPHCKLEKLGLRGCGITDEGVSALTSALGSNPSHLTELDLTKNKIGDSVKWLSDVLQNPNCKMEKLRLSHCGITDEGVSALTSALRSNPSHLRELNLSGNKIGDSVKLLSDVLQNPHCKLEKLRLYNCGVTDEGVSALTSALRSNPSHLRELGLMWNKIGDSVKLLFDMKDDPHYKLEKVYCLI